MSISFFDLYSTLEWDKLLEKFLSQSINLENGSLNIWNDSTKPRGLTYEDFGKTGINTSRGLIETWDGSTWKPILGNLVTEKNIRNLIQDELNNFHKNNNLSKEIQSDYINNDININTNKDSIEVKKLNIDQESLQSYIKSEVQEILSSLVYKELTKILPILVETYLFNKTYNSLLDSSEVNSIINQDNILLNNNKQTSLNLNLIEVYDNYIKIDIELFISKEDESNSFGLYLTDNNLDWKNNKNWIHNNNLNESFNNEYNLSKLSKSSNSIFNKSIVLKNIFLPKDYNIIALVKNPSYVVRKTEKLRSFILKYVDLNLLSTSYSLSLTKSSII